MTTELHTQINDAFGKYVDESDKLSKYFLEITEENKFNRKKIEAAFNEYLSGIGAEGEDLQDITNEGMEILQDLIIPNKDTLFPKPIIKSKLKLNDMTPKEKEAKKVDSKAEETTKTAAKKKLSVGVLKKKEETPSAHAEKAEEAPEEETVTPKKGAKRASGYTIFYNSVKDEVKERLKSEWTEKYPDAPYRSNPAEVSREIGRMWKEMNENESEQANDFKHQADARNAENGIVSRAKAKTPEDQKKPLTGFQMYHKLKKDEVLVAHREQNGMEEDDAIKPTDAMTIVSKAWNTFKKDPENVAEMNRLADEYNKEHGRVHHPKKKSDKKSDKKTNAYLEFCAHFRKEHREEIAKAGEEFNPYTESQMMNQKWNDEIKADKDKHEAWKQVAKEENLSRGFEEKETKKSKA